MDKEILPENSIIGKIKLPYDLKNYDKDYFQGRIKAYHDYAGCRGIMYDLALMIFEALPHKPKTILDVGCAYGYFPQWFYKQGIMAKGVEPSDWARSQADENFVDNIFNASLPTLRNVGENYDLVTCLECIEHIPEEWTKKSLKRIYNLTNKYLILLIGLEPPGGPQNDREPTHINLHQREWWNSIVRELGMKRNLEIEIKLSDHPISRKIGWTKRIMVIEK